MTTDPSKVHGNSLITSENGKLKECDNFVCKIAEKLSYMISDTVDFLLYICFIGSHCWLLPKYAYKLSVLMELPCPNIVWAELKKYHAIDYYFQVDIIQAYQKLLSIATVASKMAV